MKKIRFHHQLMALVITFVLVFFIGTTGIAAQSENPQKSWQQYKTPEEAGFSSEKILEAKKVYDQMDAAAFLVVYHGKVLISWGDVTRRYILHSVRKSFMSALYGTHVADGSINLEKTLEELKIDDISPLSKEEKQAKVIDLLKARSGVYHPAAAETPGMKARRPKRGSYPRDTFWYYNNWDFNVLCTILEQETGVDFFEDLKKRIANPIGMEDYRVFDGCHSVEIENSKHAAYPFKLSARDMARFGQLFLQQGKWDDRQVIPKEWIKESTTAYSCAGSNFGYGYLWWIFQDFNDVGGMYAGLGVGTQVLAVLPGANMVMIQRVDTYQGKNAPPNKDLVRMILEAKAAEPKPNPELIPLQNTPSYQRPKIITLKPSVLKKYIKEYKLGEDTYFIKESNGCLVGGRVDGMTYQLLPVSTTHFIMEDAEDHVLFELDKKGVPVSFLTVSTPESVDLYTNITKIGPEAAIKAYNEKRKSQPDTYIFKERELIRLGYQLLERNKLKASVEVFKLNTELYPNSANAYDSLGEAYMKSGDTEQAIANYKKSLELNPENKNAEERLKELEARKN